MGQGEFTSERIGTIGTTRYVPPPPSKVRVKPSGSFSVTEKVGMSDSLRLQQSRMFGDMRRILSVRVRIVVASLCALSGIELGACSSRVQL